MSELTSGFELSAKAITIISPYNSSQKAVVEPSCEQRGLAICSAYDLAAQTEGPEVARNVANRLISEAADDKCAMRFIF